MTEVGHKLVVSTNAIIVVTGKGIIIVLIIINNFHYETNTENNEKEKETADPYNLSSHANINVWSR